MTSLLLITKNEQTLLAPNIFSLPIRAYTIAHTKAHSTAAGHLQPFSEHKKNDAFFCGFKPYNLYTARSLIIYPRILSLPQGISPSFALLHMPGLTPSEIPPLVASNTLIPSLPALLALILLLSLPLSSPTILSDPLVPLPVQRFILLVGSADPVLVARPTPRFPHAPLAQSIPASLAISCPLETHPHFLILCLPRLLSLTAPRNYSQPASAATH